MLRYIFKRLLIFIPTLIIISLMAFVISTNAPGDPVERLSKSANKEGTADQQSSATKKVKQDIRKRLGLDLPIFYVSLATLGDCDTLYRIDDKSQQENLQNLTRKYGNWEAVSRYYHTLKTLSEEHSILDIEKIYRDNSVISYVKIGEGDTARIDTIINATYSKNEINDAKNNSSISVLNLLESYNEPVINAKIEALENTYKEYKFLKPLADRFTVVKASF